MPNDLFLRGTCKVHLDEQDAEPTTCYLDLERQKLCCHIQDDSLFHSQFQIDGHYTVTDLKLQSPIGELFASSVPVAFASRVGGGRMSVSITQITQILAIDASAPTIEFIVNEAIDLETSAEGDELLFFPGFDLSGTIDTEAGFSITGAKGHLSVAHCGDSDVRNLVLALGVATGAPNRKFARLRGQTLTIWLNNFGNGTGDRPIIFIGAPYRDIRVTQENFRTAFDCAYSHVLNLAVPHAISMRNAVGSFLEGRVLSGSYELKLLAAYHFLEWFDGTRTLDANALARRFDVTRSEADGICLVRNGLVHNNRDLSDLVRSGMSLISKSPSFSFPSNHYGNDGYLFMNYLYTLLGDALLKEVGYTSRTQRYLPPFL